MLRPANPLVEKLYYAYLRMCLAFTGFMFQSNPAALNCKQYFIDALQMFYSADELSDLLRDLGYSRRCSQDRVCRHDRVPSLDQTAVGVSANCNPGSGGNFYWCTLGRVRWCRWRCSTVPSGTMRKTAGQSAASGATVIFCRNAEIAQAFDPTQGSSLTLSLGKGKINLVSGGLHERRIRRNSQTLTFIRFIPFDSELIDPSVAHIHTRKYWLVRRRRLPRIENHEKSNRGTGLKLRHGSHHGRQ